MAKSDYIFIDESGDLGSGEGDSSKYYAELAFHINDESISPIVKHITYWRYVKHFDREMKMLGNKTDIENFLAPFFELSEKGLVSCSAVYLIKDKYTGPYLKPTSPRGENPIYLRNFVHRKLLVFHFSQHDSATDNIELIFDRFEMSSDALINLEIYLNKSYDLPAFKHITHADSIYTDFLQITSIFANCVKDLIMEDGSSDKHPLGKFISLMDITDIQK